MHRGRQCERLAREHFEKQGYIFVTAQLPLYFAEVDLLLLSPTGELVVIEVKSVQVDLAFRPPVGSEQRRRLSRVFEQLVRTSERPVRMHLAAVNQQGEVVVYLDFLADQV